MGYAHLQAQFLALRTATQLSARGALPCLLLALTGCSTQPTAEAPPATTQEPAEEAAPPEETPAAEKSDASASSARPAEWGYEGEESPSHWADLSPAYAACAQGVMQSPVDIPSSSANAGEALSFSYGSAQVNVSHNEHMHDLIDNGHTIQVNVDEGASLTTARETYALKQFHFHTPSENRIDGKAYPMEAHFVHQSESGDFAVLAVFFEVGEANPGLQKLIDHFPAQKGESLEVDTSIDLAAHLPADSKTFHFLGSFTTPPCTENVEWIVYEKTHSISQEQVDAFHAKLGNNNRPTQDFRARPLSETALSAKGN